MKILAGIGLLFFAYCFLQIVSKWQYRNAIEKTIWFAIIGGARPNALPRPIRPGLGFVPFSCSSSIRERPLIQTEEVQVVVDQEVNIPVVVERGRRVGGSFILKIRPSVRADKIYGFTLAIGKVMRIGHENTERPGSSAACPIEGHYFDWP